MNRAQKLILLTGALEFAAVNLIGSPWALPPALLAFIPMYLAAKCTIYVRLGNWEWGRMDLRE